MDQAKPADTLLVGTHLAALFLADFVAPRSQVYRSFSFLMQPVERLPGRLLRIVAVALEKSPPKPHELLTQGRVCAR